MIKNGHGHYSVKTTLDTSFCNLYQVSDSDFNLTS